MGWALGLGLVFEFGLGRGHSGLGLGLVLDGAGWVIVFILARNLRRGNTGRLLDSA